MMMTAACGHKNNGNTDPDGGNGGGDGGGSNAFDAAVDAFRFGGACTPGGPQCSNCIDDDGDGRIDGFDPECTGPMDNDERTFATGIPGDNKDAVNQDCFFDGDSGAGNDGCNVHVCCLLGAKTVAECPSNLGQNKYNPNDCPPPIGTKPLSQMCIDVCGKLTPPGCDCFGCCTICDPVTNKCYDIDINPADSTTCTPDAIGDPAKCLRCTKNTQCGTTQCNGSDPTSCVLCPGQDPSDLPPSCNGTAACPSGEQTCTNDSSCPTQTYCSNGCCIGVIL